MVNKTAFHYIGILERQTMDTLLMKLLVPVVIVAVVTCTACPRHCSCSKTHNGTDVVCKRNNYTQFPEGLPKDTIYLKFTYSDVTILTKENFTFLENLQTLIISHCKINSIANDTFTSLKHLVSLELTYNPFKPKDMLWLTTCGANKLLKLEVLNLGNTNMGIQQMTLFIECLLHQVNLQSLFLSGNTLRYLPDYLFSKLQYLHQLDVSQARLSEPLNVLAFANMTSLKRLHLEHNYLLTFPNFSNSEPHGSMPRNLEFIELNYNNIVNLPSRDVGLKNISYLNVGNNHIGTLDDSLLSSIMPSLTTLIVQNNVIEPYKLFLKSNSLTILNLEYNKITLDNKTNVLQYLPNLRKLQIDGNDLSGFWNPDLSDTFFKYNSKLVHLSMAVARIAKLHQTVFWNLPQLEILILFDNAISFIHPRLFEKALLLRKLDLRNNKITVIFENIFPLQVLQHMDMLELGENPYDCNCDLIWFTKWMNQTSITLGQTSHYRCLTPPEQKGKPLLQFHMPPEMCISKKSNLAYRLSISLSVSISIIFAISVVVYKFRWHIGYLYFLLQSKRRRYKAIHDSTEYQYDAFIVYNTADLHWLINDLLPKLEVEYGFKLCIHDRDWSLGCDIYDNIVDSISSSRKTILLVSNDFATSEWCHFEMTMAQSKLFEEDRNALIMILLEDLQQENITPRLAMQMKRQTFVMWTDNEMGRKLFWKKLHRALKRPVGSAMHNATI